MSFTAAELAEMALADAEIEAEFALTMDDLSLSRMLDRRANLERMDPGLRKLAEYHRAYREANKDKLAERQRAYYEANKDKLAEQKRAIKSIREEFGMTQRDLANLLGVTQSTISFWESGSVPVDLEKLREIMLRGEPPCENC